MWKSEILCKMQNFISNKLFSTMCLYKGLFIMAVIIEKLDSCFAIYTGSRIMKTSQAPFFFCYCWQGNKPIKMPIYSRELENKDRDIHVLSNPQGNQG